MIDDSSEDEPAEDNQGGSDDDMQQYHAHLGVEQHAAAQSEWPPTCICDTALTGTLALEARLSQVRAVDTMLHVAFALGKVLWYWPANPF